MLAPDATTPVTLTVRNETRAVEGLRRKLQRAAPGPVACCYEAGPCGYALQRQLEGGRVQCQVIAPALVAGGGSGPAGGPLRNAASGAAATNSTATAPRRRRSGTLGRAASSATPPGAAAAVLGAKNLRSTGLEVIESRSAGSRKSTYAQAIRFPASSTWCPSARYSKLAMRTRGGRAIRSPPDPGLPADGSPAEHAVAGPSSRRGLPPLRVDSQLEAHLPLLPGPREALDRQLPHPPRSTPGSTSGPPARRLRAGWRHPSRRQPNGGAAGSSTAAAVEAGAVPERDPGTLRRAPPPSAR